MIEENPFRVEAHCYTKTRPTNSTNLTELEIELCKEFAELLWSIEKSGRAILSVQHINSKNLEDGKVSVHVLITSRARTGSADDDL